MTTTTSDMSRRERGRWGEDRAAALYRREGFEILDRNWRSPEREVRGELDLIARRGDLIVICEVKARRNGGVGGAVAAVGAAKQERIRTLAGSWLRERRPGDVEVRFDVVAIDGVQLTWYDRAF